MKLVHTKCGGEIDVRRHRCYRCKKQWTLVGFYLDPFGVRQVKGNTRIRYNKGATVPDYSGLPKRIISHLPKWPRWARILSTIVVLGLIALVIWLVRR